MPNETIVDQNAKRIEQTIRLTRATLEMMLNQDKDAKCLIEVKTSNIEETNRAILDNIEYKIKNVFEEKFIK